MNRNPSPDWLGPTRCKVIDRAIADIQRELGDARNGSSALPHGTPREQTKESSAATNAHAGQDALRWIPVSERQPEGEEVLYWDGDTVSTFFPATGDEKGNQAPARCEQFGITHWMPMPPLRVMT